jgi:hypothetical protein
MKHNVVIGIILLWIFNLNLLSKEFEGHTILDNELVGQQTLPLHGVGIRKATIFNIQVYLLAFYYPHKITSEDELLNKPKSFVLKFKFLRDISLEKITDSFQSGFTRNAVDLKTFSNSWKLLQIAFKNFQKNDEMILVFDGEKLMIKTPPSETVIDQIEFIPQLLKLWFGNLPNDDLKKGLLSL